MKPENKVGMLLTAAIIVLVLGSGLVHATNFETHSMTVRAQMTIETQVGFNDGFLRAAANDGRLFKYDASTRKLIPAVGLTANDKNNLRLYCKFAIERGLDEINIPIVRGEPTDPRFILLYNMHIQGAESSNFKSSVKAMPIHLNTPYCSVRIWHTQAVDPREFYFLEEYFRTSVKTRPDFLWSRPYAIETDAYIPIVELKAIADRGTYEIYGGGEKRGRDPKIQGTDNWPAYFNMNSPTCRFLSSIQSESVITIRNGIVIPLPFTDSRITLRRAQSCSIRYQQARYTGFNTMSADYALAGETPDRRDIARVWVKPVIITETNCQSTPLPVSCVPQRFQDRISRSITISLQINGAMTENPQR